MKKRVAIDRGTEHIGLKGVGVYKKTREMLSLDAKHLHEYIYAINPKAKLHNGIVAYKLKTVATSALIKGDLL